jgi:capsid protein
MTDLKLDPEKIAKLKKFDVLEHLQTPEDIEEFLKVANEENDPEFHADTLKVIAAAVGQLKNRSGANQHEAADRTHVCLSQFRDHVVDHTFIQNHPQLAKMAENAEAQMAELYQAIWKVDEQ